MSTTQSGKTLLSETRDLMRRLHYSIHTERAYCDWIARFVRFHHMQARETLFVESEKKLIPVGRATSFRCPPFRATS